MFLNQILSLTKEQTFYSSLLTLLFYMYGLISTPLFWVLVFFMTIDFVLGVYSAWKNKELDWNLCLEGIANKLFVGILVVMSALVDFALFHFGIHTRGLFHNFIMAALITRELGSGIKNAEKAKLWVPKIFKDAAKKIGGKKW